MNKIPVIIFLVITTNVFGQRDTLYFDANWHETVKDSASFYRPMPLEKVGESYKLKDYYSNGVLQMEGFYSNVELQELDGQAKWYYPTGQLSEIRNYRKGKRDGETLYYSKKGFLRARGMYQDNEYWSGTFIDNCCYNGYVPEYQDGKKVGKRLFFSNSKQIAVKISFKNDSTTITKYYNRKGKQIGNLLTVNQFPREGRLASFYMNDEDDVVALERYFTYKEGKMNGEEAAFTKEGKQLSKGINKNEEPYSGTIMRSNIVKTYINGKLEGSEIGYSEKMAQLSKGINKDNEHWKGQFIELYENKISSYDMGKVSGKQLEYYKGDFDKIKSFYHILNEKKEGESVHYDKTGKVLAKGTYKNNLPWNGTFLDTSGTLFSSYKQGEKHGTFIQYDNKGEIIGQMEFENDKPTGIGNSKTQGLFQKNKCECTYKNGEPFSGEVCSDYSLQRYQNGMLIKQENYEYNYDTHTVDLTDDSSYDTNGIVTARTILKNNIKYTLTFKDGQPFDGVSYSDNGIISYKKGKKDGPFSHLKNENRELIINGNYKNDLWNGLITFKETRLGRADECVFIDGQPIDGTVIENRTFTSYRRGLKVRLEELVTEDGIQNKIKRIITYSNGVPVDETWPNQKNANGEIIKGVFKNSKPYEGYFFEFKPAIGALTNYKNGVITGTQYVGYNDNQTLIVLDSMSYKSGKPYQGKLLEHYGDKLHNHYYDKGVLVKTVVTDDFYRDRVRNTITYSKTGFVITDKDSDLVLCNLTYLDMAKTRAKVEFAPTVDEFSGSMEFHNNEITAIDVVFIDSKTTTITYDLVDADLVVTIKSNGITVKAFPELEHIKKFSYRNFLDLEKLFMDGMVVFHTYIDGKKVATGVRKDTDMYDGIHIWANSRNNSYRYLKFEKGKSLDDQDNLTKKELLKLLKD